MIVSPSSPEDPGTTYFKRANLTSTSRGFSMTEIVVVVTIIMILGAFSLPQLMNAVYASRIRGAATDLSGLVQQARELAEQQNATVGIFTGTVDGGKPGAFVNCYRSGSNDTCPAGTTWVSGVGEPDVALTSGITVGTGSNAPSGLAPGFTPEAAGSILYFNPRGLPSSSTGASLLTQGYVLYLTDTHGNWAAVAVSPAGRSKVWSYNGYWH